MLLLALLVEGPATIGQSLTTLMTPTGWLGLAGLAYTVVIATILGSGIWSWLMSRNPAGVVAPFSMLVPIVGMSAAWFVLGETVSLGEMCGAVLVIVGVLGAGMRAAKDRRSAPRWCPQASKTWPTSPRGRPDGAVLDTELVLCP